MDEKSLSKTEEKIMDKKSEGTENGDVCYICMEKPKNPIFPSGCHHSICSEHLNKLKEYSCGLCRRPFLNEFIPLNNRLIIGNNQRNNEREILQVNNIQVNFNNNDININSNEIVHQRKDLNNRPLPAQEEDDDFCCKNGFFLPFFNYFGFYPLVSLILACLREKLRCMFIVLGISQVIILAIHICLFIMKGNLIPLLVDLLLNYLVEFYITMWNFVVFGIIDDNIFKEKLKCFLITLSITSPGISTIFAYSFLGNSLPCDMKKWYFELLRWFLGICQRIGFELILFLKDIYNPIVLGFAIIFYLSSIGVMIFYSCCRKN